MDRLQVFLFGNPRIVHSSHPNGIRLTRNAQGLLAYLLLQRHRPQHREVLADLFWPEQPRDKSHGCLSTTLWRLRTALEPKGIPPGTYLVSRPTGEVGFNWESSYWLDVETFEEWVGSLLGKSGYSLDEAQAQKLDGALKLYSSDLLMGFYDDWALRERERLRGLYLNGLAYLMSHQKQQGNYEISLAIGLKITSLEPLREEVHRELMRIYVDSGQRAMAIRQYKTCCAILSATLGISPMEETQNLYIQIASGTPPPGSAMPLTIPVSRREALAHLQLATQTMRRAQEQLQHAIALVEQTSDDV